MKILLLTLITISIRTYGQYELTVDNPAPRVGDDIEINIKIKESKDWIADGKLKIYKTITDAGQLNIGPFKFVIGDKEYKTDSLKINVSPKLPDDIKDGMWLRLAEFKGENFLIIEQRISNQWKREKHSEDETTMTHGDGVTYFELKKDILEKNGLEISRKSSGTHSEILDKNDFLGNGTVSFKIEIYKFKKTDNFKKRIRLDKNLFNNLPDKIKVDEIWIE